MSFLTYCKKVYCLFGFFVQQVNNLNDSGFDIDDNMSIVDSDSDGKEKTIKKFYARQKVFCDHQTRLQKLYPSGKGQTAPTFAF